MINKIIRTLLVLFTALAVFVNNMGQQRIQRVKFALTEESKSDPQTIKIPDSRFEIDEDGYYLINMHRERLAGPFIFIKDHNAWNWEDPLVYMEKGLYGYIGSDGRKITPSIFSDCEEEFMDKDSVWVKEPKSDYYYIDCAGNRLFMEEYDEVEPFEMQGNFARVRCKGKDTWSIIDRRGKEIITDLMEVNALPITNVVGSGVNVSNNVVIFRLPIQANEQLAVYELPDFNHVEMSCDEDFVIVTDRNTGLKGVVNSYGEIIIPAGYSKVEYTKYMNEKGEFDDEFTWILHKPDGINEVKKMSIFPQIPSQFLKYGAK